MRPFSALALVASTLLAACLPPVDDLGGTVPDGYVLDADGDGYAGGADCDDATADTHPGAPDAAGDGLDADCDGIDGVDRDGDGAASRASGGNDCDDEDRARQPGAADPAVDGVDQDCDGVDGPDVDRDGAASAVVGGTDCDDGDATVYPGAADTSVDGVDQDCSGLDGNQSGGGGGDTGVSTTDADGDGVDAAGLGGIDCDDTDATVHPGARDTVGDGTDQNCDGLDGFDWDDDGVAAAWSGGTDCDDTLAAVKPGVADADVDDIDQDCDGVDGPDADADGYADLAVGGTDCDDDDAAVHPDAADLDVDGTDDDCDGLDGEDGGVSLLEDLDADGYMDASFGGTDCDDVDRDVHPGATEACDGVDNDCDGLTDDADIVPSELRTRWFYDVDGDGWGASAQTMLTCVAPRGYVGQAGDCDEAAVGVHPGASETCDGVDNDCDGYVDAADHDLPADALQTFYVDQDGDGYGGADAPQYGCAVPDGFVADGGDCDDRDVAVNPAATETCDGADNDCDGAVDDDDASLPADQLVMMYTDGDGDGYGVGSPRGWACFPAAGEAADSGDCNDSDPSVGGPTTWFFDGDSDGYGTSSSPLGACAAPNGYVGNDDDCNDSNAAVSPADSEVWGNGLDDDCDGVTDPVGMVVGSYLGSVALHGQAWNTSTDCTGSISATISNLGPSLYVQGRIGCGQVDGTIVLSGGSQLSGQMFLQSPSGCINTDSLRSFSLTASFTSDGIEVPLSGLNFCGFSWTGPAATLRLR
jgi:hypothetical protein